jgi:HEAT repeat protein
VRRLAVERAAEEGPEVIPLLLDALGDADRRVRLAAIEALGRLGSPEARERVKVIALTGQGADRAAALKALGAIRGPDAQEVLLNAVQSGDRALQVAAITGLSELDSEEAIEALMVQVRLEDAGDSELRTAALEGLRRIGGASVRAKVQSWLAQASGEHTRADAAILLGHLLDMSAAPVLLDLLKQPKWRGEARSTLTRLFVADLGDDLFAYQALQEEGRTFEQLFLSATGLDGEFTVADLRGAGAKPEVIGPALVKLVADPRWFVREDAEALLRELASARPEPLARDASVAQLKARQDYWTGRLTRGAPAAR